MPTKQTPFLSERKLRKLRRDPKLFFLDAVRNRASTAGDLAIRAVSRLPVSGVVSCRRRYTVISAVYNVEKYLDRYFESMSGQTVSLDDHIELIMVDDGSTDGSAEVIEAWRRKHPRSIRYLRKENGGQASARNLGLGYMTGEWVTFIDPDDFVNLRYFEQVDRFLDTHEAVDVGLLCCKWVFYFEKGGRFVDSHPLNYRFRNGSLTSPLDQRSDAMAPSAATSFFRADVLAKNRHRFDEQIRPNFEDAHFAGHYLLMAQGLRVGFVAESTYFYRKREDGSSTQDLGWRTPSRFSTVIERGHLDLLVTAAEAGEVPTSVQRLVLYDLFWYFKKIIDNEVSVAFLSDEQKARFFVLVKQVFDYIDAKTILHFNLAGSWFFHKVGFLGLFKGVQPESQIVYVRDYDPAKRLVRLSYFYHGEPLAECFAVDGQDTVPSYAKVQTHDFLGETFVNERVVWLELREGYSVLEVEFDGVSARVAGVESSATRAMIQRTVELKKAKVKPPVQAQALRKLARTRRVRSRFNDAWLFLDRDTQADDNAEHLYRWVHRNRPDINAFFVLSRDSHDWSRLEEEGFSLIVFGSLDHKLLLLNASHVLSSHADSFVLRVLEPASYRDMLDYRFVFLQHGVIRDDISRWLNAKPIDLFVTSSPREHASIVANGPYKFTQKETRLVGLARHDGLLERTEPTENIVLVMPTWRMYLAGAPALGTTRRSESQRFYDSNYARTWKSFLHSEELREMVEEHGYRVVFFPHANVQMYVDWFEAPAWVDVRTHQTEPILQKLYRRAKLLVTDYSSVFFEMGILEKPCIYYQFDFDEMYGGAHPSRIGYFDFERDGFGPVVTTELELLTALRRQLRGDGKTSPEYLARMRACLPLRDGGNRARTVAAIEELASEEVDGSQLARIRQEQARAAMRRGIWELAERGWESIVADEESALTLDERLLCLARAKRGVGNLPEARDLLCRVVASSDEVALGARVERAELAGLEGDMDGALALWSELADEDLESLGLDAEHASLASVRLHRQLGNLDTARVRIATLSSTPCVMLERAELSLAASEFAEAASRFSDLADATGETGYRIRSARAWCELGEVTAANAELASYASEGGSSVEAELLGAELLFLAGDIEGAEAAGDSLLAASELVSSGEHRLALAKLLMLLGRLEQSERALVGADGSAAESLRWELWGRAERWSAIASADRSWLDAADPDQRERGVSLLARALGEVGTPERGLTVLHAFLSNGRVSTAASLRTEGELLHTSLRWEEAVAVWEKHLSEYPGTDSQWVRARLALALERSGDRAAATRVLVESARVNALERLQLDPNDADAYAQLVWART